MAYFWTVIESPVACSRIPPTRSAEKMLIGPEQPSCPYVVLNTKGSMAMWKKVLLASAFTGLLAVAAIPVQTTPADASRSGCHEAAKAKFPHNSRARRDFKRYCKNQWKAYKAAHGVK